MKNSKNIVIGILVIAFITLLLKYCKGGRVEYKESVKIDTVWREVKKDTVYAPQPYAVYLKGKLLPPEYVFDTLYLPEQVPDDECQKYYNQLKDYFSRIYLYSDTVKNQYGSIVINDTVTQNKIAARGVKTDFKIPEITKTITLIEPRKNQIYAGAGVWGSSKDFLSGIELNLSLKTKQNRIIGVGYQNLFNVGSFYKLEYRHLISFKKRVP